MLQSWDQVRTLTQDVALGEAALKELKEFVAIAYRVSVHIKLGYINGCRLVWYPLRTMFKFCGRSGPGFVEERYLQGAPHGQHAQICPVLGKYDDDTLSDLIVRFELTPQHLRGLVREITAIADN